MKNTIIVSIVSAVIIIIGVTLYLLTNNRSNSIKLATNQTQNEGNTTVQETIKKEEASTEVSTIDKSKTIIGKSVEGNDITAYHYGEGNDEILFIGGIHGGYEWNTTLVAYQLMDYLKTNTNIIPKNIKVTVIPVLNPDGLNKVVGTTGIFSQKDVSSSEATVISGRFNANNVDLNRNFDCDWKTSGKWQDKTVSGGKSAFSEPESLAIKNYTETNKPTAVIAWYSAAGGVFSSSCHNGVSKETAMLTEKFATASQYPAYKSFDFYATTGDMVNWFAKNNIPAISVLLTDHINTDWAKNQKGIDSILKYYAK